MLDITPKQTEAAELKLAGLTYAEIAATQRHGGLPVSPESIRKRLYRARRRVLAKVPQNERDAARQEALRRYAVALSSRGKPVRFNRFSLFPGEA